MDKHKISVEVDLLAKVDQFSGAIASMQKQLSKLKLNQGLKTEIESSFSNIEREMKKISEISQKGKINIVDEREITKSLNKVERSWTSVLNKLKKVGANTTFLEKDKKGIDALRSVQEKYNKKIEDTKNSQRELNRELDEARRKQQRLKDIQESLDEKETTLGKVKEDIKTKKANKKGHKGLDEEEARLTKSIDALKKEKEELLGELSPEKFESGLVETIEKLEKELNKIDTALKNPTTALKEFKEKVEGVNWKELGVDWDQITTIEQLNEALETLRVRAGDDAKNAIETLKNTGETADNTFESMREEVDKADRELEELTQRQKDLDDLRNKLLAFFSINNAAQIFQRAIRNAYQAIKELDEVMTQTAVVTDFTVGDMWSQLPEYTDRANELGVAVKGVYEASTLYYQQGLKTEEVVAVSTETLKMAKIAGLDYADATDFMTAALRGFNMEVNETNSLRINDVYSELAAITAADTSEIAKAMTKTASIASNANMEFETTAAFLSQIIETTRESAETAGTAMKTVIARFQELKKDPSEIGEVDGEIVDANKIETALRTVGVALRDSNGQFRDLDDVFLELAKKWKSLDTNTQRYIATIAAGSRQQSRFIAMMSNYERTMELVNAANNSAGASQKQFDKTLESLASKLERLSNAWNEFSMGIANSTVIKTGIDLLTELLEVVNGLTSAFGDVGGAITKLGLGFATFAGGNKLLKGKLMTSLVKGVFGKDAQVVGGKAGQEASESFLKVFSDKIKNTEDISNKTKKSLFSSFFLNAETKEAINFKELWEDKDLEESDLVEIRKQMQAKIGGLNTDSSKKRAISKMLDGDIESIKLANEEMKKYGGTITTTTVSTKAIGGALATAGLAASFFGKQLEDAGYEKAGETISNLGTAATAFGGAITVLGPIAASAGGAIASAFWPVTTILGTIIGSAIILDGIFESTAEKEERLAKQTEEAQQKTAELTDEYNKLTDTIENLDQAEKTLDTLIEGSDAWKDKVEEINQEMLELVKLYPQLKKYLSLSTDGLYTWTDEGAALEELQQLKLEARNDALATEAGLAQETLDLTLTKNRTFTAPIEIIPEGNIVFDTDIEKTHQITEGALSNTLELSNEGMLELAKAYQKDANAFGSIDSFKSAIEDISLFPQEFIDNITSFEGQLIPILEEILDAQQIAEQTKDNYLTAVLSNNKDFVNSENKDYIRDRIKNSEAYKNYEANYTDAKIIAKTEKDLRAQGYQNVKVGIDANGEVTYSYDDNGNNVTGSKGAKETMATIYAMEDYSKSGDLETDVQKFEEQRQNGIDKIAQDYIEAGVDETLAKVTAAEIIDEAAATGKLDENGSLLPGEINNGQLLEHLDISKLYELKEQLDETTELGKAVAQAIDSIRKKNFQLNEASSKKSGLNEQLTKAYELFNLTGTAADKYKDKVKEATGLDGEALDRAVIAKLEFEWADDQIDEVYDEVMAAFKMDDTDPRKFQAFEGLLPAFKKLLGNEDLTVDFIIDNQKEVLNFLNGVDGSLEELQAKSFLTLYADNHPARQSIEGLLGDLEGIELEIGMKFTVENMPNLKVLNEALAKGDIALDEAKSILSQLGLVAQTSDHAIMNYSGGKLSSVDKFSRIESVTSFINSSNEPKYTPPEDKGKEEDPWENPYDKQYNALEKVAEAQRKRNKLEDDFQRAQTQGVAGYEVTKFYYDQLFQNYEDEKEAQKELLKSYEEDYTDFITNNQQFKDLASYDKKTGVITIKWEEIDKLEAAAKEQGETLEKEIAELERLQEGLEGTNDNISKIDTERAQREKELQDAYLAFEERLAAALENIERETLEEQQKIFDALTSAEEQLVDALNRNVDEMRQARENEQRQQEISDKERRLAYLRQDTTGANQLEIRQLEKEIGEEKENYRDELIDQSLEKLQKQNEAAAKQREKQISLMESQIEYALENGLYNKEAAQMLKNASKNGFAYDPKIWNTLRNGENWDAKTETAVKAVKDAVKQDLATAIVALANSLGTKTSLSNSNNNSSGGGGSSGRTFSAHGSTGTYTIGSEKGITFLVGAQPGDTLTSSDTGDKSTWTMGSDGTATITTQNGDSFTINRADLGLKPFATGGLADFTGPAWLDGTRSKPELVLNAQDTENFLILKDVLSGVLANAPGAKSSGGDNYFDIDVNVDEIGSDYDVDQMAERIKQNIYQDGMYRNVNTINLLR